MPTKLSDKAVENSTYGIACLFREKVDGVYYPFTPNVGLKWSLRDKNGDPVNGKENQPLTPAESVTIVLSGQDLALTGGPTTRYVTVEGTYNGILGNDLPIVDEVSFQIINITGKP